MATPKISEVRVTHVGAPDPKRVAEHLRHVEEWLLLRDMPVEASATHVADVPDVGVKPTRAMVEDEVYSSVEEYNEI